MGENLVQDRCSDLGVYVSQDEASGFDRGKNVSKQIITTAQCRWMKNIKEPIWMNAKEAGLASLHVFIMSSRLESKTGKRKQGSPGQTLTELCRWEIESEISTNPEDTEKKKGGGVSHKRKLIEIALQFQLP